MRLNTLGSILNAVAVTRASVIAWPPQTWNTTEEKALHGLTRRAPYPQDIEGTSRYQSQGPGFWRFEWVDNNYLQPGDRLARSSAPHYNCKDCDQRLTPASIQFLKDKKISHVISLNNEATSRSIKSELIKNGIAYTALPTRDFQAPTQEDLKTGYEAFKKNRHGTLVWCGYGHGRTGTMISALQILSNHDKPTGKKISHWEYKENHVETTDQIQLLDNLQKSLHTPNSHKHTGDVPEPVEKPVEAPGRFQTKEAAKDPAKLRSGQQPSNPKPAQESSKPVSGQVLPKWTPVLEPKKDAPKPNSGQQQTSKPAVDRPKRFDQPARSGAKPDMKAPKIIADAGPRSFKSFGSGPPRTSDKKFGSITPALTKPSSKGPKVVVGSIPGPRKPKLSGQRFGPGRMPPVIPAPRRISSPTQPSRNPGPVANLPLMSAGGAWRRIGVP